jgi:hypothetical protein
MKWFRKKDKPEADPWVPVTKEEVIKAAEDFLTSTADEYFTLKEEFSGTYSFDSSDIANSRDIKAAQEKIRRQRRYFWMKQKRELCAGWLIHPGHYVEVHNRNKERPE